MDLFVSAGLTRSKSDARRLVQQGGAYVNDEPVQDIEALITDADLEHGEILLRAGKKRFHRIVTG